MNIQELKYKLYKGEGRTQTIKKNILGSFAVKGISILVSLALVPMTLGYVSSEIYGVWLIISSILHWLVYMDVGFTLGLKNRLAEALAKQDYDKGRSLVSTTYYIMAIIFVPIAIISLIISPYINWCSIFNVNHIYQEDVLRTVQLLFAFMSLQMIVNVFVAVVAAFQKVALSSLFNVIGQACALVIIFLMTKFVPPSLSNLAFAFSLMPILVVTMASLIFFNGRFKRVAPSIHAIDTHYIKDLWSLGAKFFIIQVQVIVLYQATNILISHTDGPIAVTQYNIAYKVFNVLLMCYTIILNPLWPAFTDAYTKQDFTWMQRIYRKMTHIFYGLCFITIVTTLLSPILYKIWIGNKVEIPFALTTAIAIYTLIYCWDSLQVLLINGIGTVKLQTYVVMIGLILHIPLSLLLGKFLGAIGVVTSMSIINIIYCIFFTTQIRKLLSRKASGIWIQ